MTDDTSPPQKEWAPPSRAVQAAMDELFNSSLYASYLREMVVLLSRVCDDLDEAKKIFAEAATSEEPFIAAEATFHDRIQSALMAAGSFVHFVRAPDPRDKRTPPTAADFMRAVRAHMLASELRHIDLSEVLAVTVRNRLEHIDEYLDKIALRLPTEGAHGTRTWLVHNMIVTNADDLNRLHATATASITLRVYEISTDIYHHLGASIHLGALRAQAALARDALVAVHRKRAPGGSLDLTKHIGGLLLLEVLDKQAK